MAPTSEQIEKGNKLVRWSRILSGGGFFVLVVGGLATLKLAGVGAAEVVAGAGIVSIVTGAFVGQIGRGMQGRAV